MPLDLEAFPAKIKLKQIKLGEQFGSQDTLDQANQTLKAHTKYASHLAPQGFVASDATRLGEARDGLIAAGVGREAAKGDKKTTSAAYVAALNAGQTARLSARSILEATRDELEETGNDAAAEGVGATLKQTAAAPSLAEPMANQADQLRAKLEDPTVKAIADGRGGADAAAKLSTAAAALRKADKEDSSGRGTPAETQRLDQLDGIIVTLARKARKAAIAAAKALGDPALARAFKLDRLYQSRGGKGEEEEGEGEAEGEAEPEAPKGESKPVAPKGESKPVAPKGENKPVAPEGESKPVAPEGENKPVAPGGENKPVAPGGESKPVAPEGESKPVDGGGGAGDGGK